MHGHDPPSLSRSTRTLPYELVYRILVLLVASTVHTVCLSSEEVSKWEFDIAAVLSSVSRTFHDTMRDIVSKALTIPDLDESQSFVLLARQKFQTLRTTGIQFREPFAVTHLPEPSGCSPLIHAYSLYLTASALRRAAATLDAGPMFRASNDLVQGALDMALQICKKILPRGVEEHLRRAIGNEAQMVTLSTTFMNAKIKLEESLNAFAVAANAESEQNAFKVDTIKVEIDQALRHVESAEVAASALIQSERKFMPSIGHPILQFQTLQNLIRQCAELQLDMDEYDLRNRACSLMSGWEPLLANDQGLCESHLLKDS